MFATPCQQQQYTLTMSRPRDERRSEHVIRSLSQLTKGEVSALRFARAYTHAANQFTRTHILRRANQHRSLQ